MGALPTNVTTKVKEATASIYDGYWPSWKKILWASALFGLLIAIVTAFDWGLWSTWLGLVLAVAMHVAVATPIAGLIVAYRTDQRWAIPWWLLGAAVLVVVVVTIDRFVLDQLTTATWSERLYVALAIGSIVLGVFLAWTRTDWVFERLRDLAWDVFSAALGFVAGVCVLIVPLAMWAHDRQTDIDDQVPEIPTVQGIGGRYVALGDSYSAGEGIEPFQPGSPRNCDRSSGAYPLLLEFDETVDVVFEACSGAVTQDVDLGVEGGSPPQIAPGTDPDVELVTITIGGNDVVFSDIVQHCFLYEDCLDRTFRPRDPHPGLPTISYPPPQDLDDWATEALGVLGKNTTRVYERIEDAYPNARVIVLGYPYLFPTGNAPAPWQQLDCSSVLRRVDVGERDRLRDRIDDLNEALYGLATAHDFEYISPAAAWVGHEPCGNEGQYTNAVKPGRQLANPVDGATLHPNVRGQQQYARLIACYLNANPEPPPTDPDPPGDLDNPIQCS